MKLTGFKLYNKQQEVVDNIIRGTEMYHTLVWGRQSGKSTTILGLILYFSINKSKSSTLFVAPVYSQVSKLQQQVIDALEPTGVIKSANKSSYEIRLVNGSVIYFRSAERADNIRGLAVEYLYIDEAQDISTAEFQ